MRSSGQASILNKTGLKTIFGHILGLQTVRQEIERPQQRDVSS